MAEDLTAGASVPPDSAPPERGAKVAIVLPTYNESGSLADIVARLGHEVPAATVLIVDDASPDGTGDLADALAAAEPHRVHVLHREMKQGLGSAYAAGFRDALARGARTVVQMDADGSHLPEELPRLLAAASPGSGTAPGLVVGARWVPGGRIVGWPHARRAISRTGTAVARAALGSRLRDITSGFRVIDADWLARVDLDRVASRGYGFQVELAWTLERGGCPVAEVPITFVERASGRSKMSVAIVTEALARVLRWGWWVRVDPRRLPALRAPERGNRPGEAPERFPE